MRTSRDTSRLQGFSDAVFALAATLLVVTLEVPNNYDELLAALAGFPAFALAFMAIISLWYNHRQFFAAYPLADTWTVVLNSLLLFTVLLYVYPLKLLSEVVAESFFGVAPDVTVEMGIPEIRGLFLIFGAAVFATTAILTVLHVNAWRLRDDLNLDDLGRYDLLQELVDYATVVLTSILSILTALLGLGLTWGLPVWLYLLSPVLIGIHRLLITGRHHR